MFFGERRVLNKKREDVICAIRAASFAKANFAVLSFNSFVETLSFFFAQCARVFLSVSCFYHFVVG